MWLLKAVSEVVTFCVKQNHQLCSTFLQPEIIFISASDEIVCVFPVNAISDLR